MPARTTGAATIRHVGLVALEALLVAMIVWVATMALAGATQSGGLIGAATAVGEPATLRIVSADAGGPVVVRVADGSEKTGPWVHVACRAGSATVASQWVRVGADHRAAARVTVPSPKAPCTAEQGYFSANGKWRVLASATFSLAG